MIYVPLPSEHNLNLCQCSVLLSRCYDLQVMFSFIFKLDLKCLTCRSTVTQVEFIYAKEHRCGRNYLDKRQNLGNVNYNRIIEDQTKIINKSNDTDNC